MDSDGQTSLQKNRIPGLKRYVSGTGFDQTTRIRARNPCCNCIPGSRGNGKCSLARCEHGSTVPRWSQLAQWWFSWCSSSVSYTGVRASAWRPARSSLYINRTSKPQVCYAFVRLPLVLAKYHVLDIQHNSYTECPVYSVQNSMTSMLKTAKF